MQGNSDSSMPIFNHETNHVSLCKSAVFLDAALSPSSGVVDCFTKCLQQLVRIRNQGSVSRGSPAQHLGVTMCGDHINEEVRPGPVVALQQRTRSMVSDTVQRHTMAAQALRCAFHGAHRDWAHIKGQSHRHVHDHPYMAVLHWKYTHGHMRILHRVSNLVSSSTQPITKSNECA